VVRSHEVEPLIGDNMLDRHYEQAEKILEKIENTTKAIENSKSEWAQKHWKITRYRLQRKLYSHLNAPKEPWIQVIRPNY
jgi:hypothetical protein